ncbi:MAG: hypothetical protein K6F80_01555 [Oscillospiraceae bacterium]|nr:hypothetical protein [Oscillospiraceae bacterium]
MFRLQKGKLCLTALLTAFVMAGCSIGINVDTMLTPPKLSAQQEQIYQALTNSTGSDIRLKYPKRGAYLSAFIVANIDDDIADEAIVFYEKNTLSTADAGLRINVLDCIDGEWRSICDRSAAGSEIEKVVLSPLGDNDRMNVIVGYSTANQSEKYLCVYNYENNYLEQSFQPHSYALFDVADTGSGKLYPDLVLLGAANASEQSAYAAVYRLEADERYHEYKYSFKDSYTDFNQLIYGKQPDGRVSLYVDAATGTSNMQTEVLSMEGTRLANVLEQCKRLTGEPFRAEDTVRRSGLPCTDIDNDGVPEIPVQNVFLGYEEAAETEQLRQTRWLTMAQPRIYAEYYSFYNAGDGYAFLLPDTWVNHVSVMRDTTEGEYRFVAYDGEWKDDMPVLMRIYIAYDDDDRDEHLANGYALMHTKGTASCLVKAEEGEALSLSIGRLLPCFRFLG